MPVSISVAATGQAMTPRKSSFESQGVTQQCYLRSSQDRSLRPGTQTLAMGLGTPEQGATGLPLPYTPGLPAGCVWTGLSLGWWMPVLASRSG